MILEKKKTGKSYMTVPGCSDMMNLVPETIERCIMRVFEADLFNPTRKKEHIYAKHFYRYILERLDKNGKLITLSRMNNKEKEVFKYSLDTIALLCECDYTTIHASTKTTKNLIQTDKAYRDKCEVVIDKIKHNLIIFP